MRWPEIPGGRAKVLCGKVLESLDFLSSFLCQGKNEQGKYIRFDTKFHVCASMQKKIFKHALNSCGAYKRNDNRTKNKKSIFKGFQAF